MTILNWLSQRPTFFLNGNGLPFLDSYDKKVLAIAPLAFSLLAATAFCVIKHYYSFKATLWNDHERQEEMEGQEEIDGKLSKLAEAIKNQTEQKPFPQLQAYWGANGHSLEIRHQFVHVFSSDESPEYQKVREIFARVIYRPLTNYQPAKWLSKREISDQLDSKLRLSRGRFNYCIDKHLIKTCSQAFYFHSTSKENLELILKSQRLEVRADNASDRGAWVSTKPTSYGPYTLVFNRNIEHLSPLISGAFFYGNAEYWAGFSQNIPVNSTTLACILYDDSRDILPTRLLSFLGLGLDRKCKEWAGREIKVLSSDTFMQDWYPKIVELKMGIPATWSDSI